MISVSEFVITHPRSHLKRRKRRTLTAALSAIFFSLNVPDSILIINKILLRLIVIFISN